MNAGARDPAVLAVTGAFLEQIRSGRRVFSKAQLVAYGAAQHVSRGDMESILHAWQHQERWIQRFVPPGHTRAMYRVSSACPVIEDPDLCRWETLLELAGKQAHFAYRTALAFHNLSEESFSHRLVIAYSKYSRRPEEVRPFVRNNRESAQWGSLDGFDVWRVARDPAQVLEHIEYTSDGLPISSAERCLLDCWLRPSHGISADRLCAAYHLWWEDQSKSSAIQKIQRLVGAYRSDSDFRPQRRRDYVDFLYGIDEALGQSVERELERD